MNRRTPLPLTAVSLGSALSLDVSRPQILERALAVSKLTPPGSSSSRSRGPDTSAAHSFGSVLGAGTLLCALRSAR